MLDLKGNRTIAPMARLSAWFTNLLGGDFRWQLLPTPFMIYADGIDVVLFEEFGAGEMALDLKDAVARNALLKDENYRRTFRKFYAQKLSPRVWQRDFGDAVILGCPEQQLIGRNFADVALERGLHVVDLFLDMVVAHGTQLRWFTVIGNHRKDVLRKMVCNPNTLITFSDAGAHLRNMAFYNLPLRLLKLVQESHGEGRPIMPIEQAIHRLTGEQADWLGIDAGRIREGDRADIVVLDPRGLQQDLERENWDTMQGFDIPRMVCRNPGCVSHVLINGRLAVDDEQVVPELGQAQGFGRFLAAR
jgi:N-acyl-D-aspartate/D-glutamate deacylase